MNAAFLKWDEFRFMNFKIIKIFLGNIGISTISLKNKIITFS